VKKSAKFMLTLGNNLKTILLYSRFERKKDGLPCGGEGDGIGRGWKGWA
jgi:hypothetical protein